MRKIPLLDLGNVVIHVDFSPFVGWLAEKSGKSPEELKRLFSSSLFFDLEFGHLTREEFARRLSLWCGADLDQRELEHEFCAIFPAVVEGMEDLLQELASEGPVYCLSNTNEIHLQYLLGRFPIMQHFTKIFASHEIHKRKPYPGVYQAVADELGLQPSAMVFFDDLPQNVDGALRAGLEAFVFKGVEPMRLQLKDFQEMGDIAPGGKLP